jgi:ABC-type bacteriocin/lantibiotic exporter with double-glycine peptidase domain
MLLRKPSLQTRPLPLWSALIGLLARLRRRKVPVLLQLSMVECGAACLAMILGYHGRKTSVAECRERCVPGRDGVNAQIIARAARGFGLRVRAYATRSSSFANAELPVIIHWNFNHFVVLERWSEREAVIVDPACGRRRIPSAEFDRSFTGVVLACAPGEQFQSAGQRRRRPWRTFAGYLLESPGLLGQIVLASLLLQAVGFGLPAITKLLFDHALAPQAADAASRILLGLVLITLIKFVVQGMRAMLLLQFQQRCDRQMMQRFFRHLLALPLPFFEQRTHGDLLMRLGSNSVVREIVTGQTLSLVLDGLMIVVYLAVLLAYSPVFALVVVGIGLAQACLLMATRGRVQQQVENDILAQTAAQGYLVEALNGIGTIKATGAEATVFAHWQNLFYAQLNASLRRSRLAALIDSALAALQLLTPLALIWLGLRSVQQGELSMGGMLALNAIATLALAPLNALIGQGQRFQVVATYLDRLFDVFDARPEQSAAAEPLRPTLSGGIELSQVSFGYDGHSQPVLSDISLQIAPGQKVAIVGQTGSGKSTLAKLMLGLYQPTRGQVRFDGVPLEQCDYSHVRSQCGVVMQDSFLFSGSIRQNIALGQAGLGLEQIAGAARTAGIHDDIARMPLGYETCVAEGSTNISGGQRQRLALARALARRPAMLLLDEGTSHLDTVTEQLVEANLAALNCTRIVIAHRLSTIRDADVILVLDQGRLVEQGSHDDLVERDGHYAALLRVQIEPALD